MKTLQMLPAFMLAIAICNEINDKDFREFPICGTFLNPVINNTKLSLCRPVGWGVLWVRTNPPTEAIEFHLAWLKQGSKVCKDNKPYAAICFK